ncbi:MAG: TolC family outer membrane protein [Pseudomonadota bacterium]
MTMTRHFIGLTAFGLALMASVPASAVTLEQAIADTLQNNPNILSQAHETESRKEELRQAKAGYYPSLDLTAGIGYEDSKNINTGQEWRDYTRKEAALLLRQMLFDGRATTSEVERQEARIASADWRLKALGEYTSLRVAEVYLELMTRQEMLRLSQENLKTHERTYDQVKLRSESGVGRMADLAQVEGRVARARANVISDENNLADALANYRRIVGSVPADGLNEPSGIDASLPATMETALQQAQDNHPTLRSAEADVDAGFAQYEATKHRFVPRLDLELGRTWGEDLDGVEGRNEDMTAMLRLRWNLFNGWRDDARKRQTAHLINEAKSIRDNTRREVDESLALSWNAYKALDSQIPYLKQHVDASLETRDAYDKQFGLGKRTLLDLLDSENELFQARRAHTEARNKRLFAQYRILAGIGALMPTLKVGAPTVEPLPDDLDTLTQTR